MEKIASFAIDHDVLVPGLYVSRVDMGDIITYDLRFKRPNDGHPLDAAAAHTVEHIFATYLRSSEIRDKVVYFGPMGCLTGFYMILKGATHGEAIKAVKNPLAAGALMVRRGEAEIGVAGNLSSTADVIRAGLRMVGTAAGSKTVSSFFFMLKDNNVCMFTDCAVIPEPTSAQLADIAISTAGVYKRVMGDEARVALLSFSTKGSAKHERVDKVRAALEEIKTREPNLLVDGELQLDAAVEPEVARLKAPGSPVAGNANVFVFPSLEAGNIGYKIAQRFGGWTALGPLLQGFAHGWHDLSRGCSSDDIYKISVVGLGMNRGGQQ